MKRHEWIPNFTPDSAYSNEDLFWECRLCGMTKIYDLAKRRWKYGRQSVKKCLCTAQADHALDNGATRETTK